MLGGDDEFVVNNDDEVEITSSFQQFDESVLAPYLLNDESNSYEVTTSHLFTKEEYQLMNRQLNVIVCRLYCFSPTNFQNLMTVHESTMKSILLERKCLFDA